MPDNRPTPPVESLSLSRAEQWTLHHVLLDALEADRTGDAVAAVPLELRQAFETLDDGGETFTRAQLKAIRAVLSRYHHRTTWWMVERPRLERLLHCVSTALDAEER